MNCHGYLAEGKIPFRELNLFVNFLRVGFFQVTRHGDVSISIPKYVLAGPNVDIDFYLPRAASPAFMGDGPDLRWLGIAVHRFMLVEA
jgi:hypothetical protein